ncbi:hypothetical protein UVI_02048390 [Ustilaginoidea virens]|nr:hypothetical protein UVI_02048390 [Ustilaginoidea virens]
MAFFPRAYYNQDKSFTPLFRLLDDYDSYTRHANSKSSHHQSALPQWQPKFDVLETADSYELYGELPGLNKGDVSIEFTEPQTIQIRGKAERRYDAGTAPKSQAEGLLSEAESRRNRRQATVEDVEDEEWSDADHSPATPTSITPEIAGPDATKTVDNAKYWLAERSTGEFSRSFNFPNRVDHDSVSARFQDGLLRVNVPKAKKPELRRVAIE